VLFDIYIDTVRNDTVRNDTVLGHLPVALDYMNSSNQLDVFHATVVQLLDEDLMSKAPIGLRSDFEFGANEPVNVLFDRSGEGKTTLYSQLWRYATEFFLRKLPAQASTSRTTSTGKPCCVPALRDLPGTAGKSKSVYKDDLDGDGTVQSLTGKRRKKTPGGPSAPAPNTVKSDSLLGLGRSTVDNSIPKVSKVSSSAPTSPFTINTWFPTPVLALAGLGVAQQSLINAGNAKFIRVTIKPVSHEGVSILLLVPVMTGQIRDLLRTECGTRARFPSADLVVETAKQPLLRYGVHVHDSSGNPSACVSIYHSHKLITF
jgi:hypothetical protein